MIQTSNIEKKYKAIVGDLEKRIEQVDRQNQLYQDEIAHIEENNIKEKQFMKKCLDENDARISHMTEAYEDKIKV